MKGSAADTACHPVIAFDATCVPDELRPLRRRVCWRGTPKENGRLDKIPIDPRTGRNASCSDPDTWGSFEEALTALQRDLSLGGVSFVFTEDDDLMGIDLDECVDEHGEITAEARRVIDAFDTYSERSPSGTGVKLFLRGRKPVWARCRSKKPVGMKEIEIYEQGRFFAVTGAHVQGTPATVEERQSALEALCRDLWPPVEPVRPQLPLAHNGFEGDDPELLARMFSAQNGAQVRRLYDGDTSAYGDDHSRADLALCAHFAFWTNGDPDRIDRLFRGSGLHREKWERVDYRNATIRRAIESCHQAYTPGSASGGAVPITHNGDATQRDDDVTPSGGRLGTRDPQTGRLILSPRRTLPTAEAYVREFHTIGDDRTLVCYAGILMEWRENRYVSIEDGAVRHRLQPWLHAALRLKWSQKLQDYELVDFESNPATVSAALESIRAYTHLPATITPPLWLGAGHLPDAREVLPCRTMNVHVPSGEIIPATPTLFTTCALDFDYDPEPEAPERWITFLEQLWGDDLESVETLQEWMGYCLLADTSQQKMLLLIGPRRSGKGTIARVLRQLVGPSNVAGPTTRSLAGNFGLQPLIGKSLAIVSDARFAGPTVATVVERLLCISGEDTLTIDRKYLGAVTMKLPTRFMFLSNELPRFTDASNALAGRFLILRLTTSFYGQEDPQLTQKLLEELPGILLWSLEGWKRLRERGHFIQPQSVADALQELEDLSSPVGAFVREECVVGPAHRVDVDVLYERWRSWCDANGVSRITTKPTFGKDLAAAFPGIRRRRGSELVPFYEGIGLR